MPSFKDHVALALNRGTKAVKRLAGNAGGGARSAGLPVQKLKHRGRELAARVRRPGPSPEGREAASGLRAENLVWIFGSGRSGSTWLRSMMGELPGYHVWEEPLVGQLFGDFHAKANQGQLKSRNFIMGEPTRNGWLRSIRFFVLDGAGYAYPNLGPEDHLVVKEPNGSAGAPLLMAALPESRMILLVRDPRDVVASVLDGARKGSWLYERKDDDRSWKKNALADKNPNAYARKRANIYMKHAGAAKRAFDAHPGPKALVRYEELREDAPGTLVRLYEQLGLPADEANLRAAAQKHSWENIPEDQKGEGKFFRKGVSGGWKEDLTERQARVVEEVTAPLLREFYPGR